MSDMFLVSKELPDEFKINFRSTCCRVLIKNVEFGSTEHLTQYINANKAGYRNGYEKNIHINIIQLFDNPNCILVNLQLFFCMAEQSSNLSAAINLDIASAIWERHEL